MRRARYYVLFLLFIITVGFVPSDNDTYMKIARSIDIFGKIYKEVSLKYVDSVNPEEFMVAGIKGLLSELDPYTVYIDESMQKDIDVITRGKYGGIGASVGVRNNRVTIVDLVEGYSAQRQGIRIGDVIYKVDSVIVTKGNYNALGGLLKGKPGSLVKIEVERAGYENNVVFNLVREEIKINNLTWYGFYPEGTGNAYLKLSGFSRTAGSEVKRALINLKKQRKIESIVLDLRGNPGGLLDAAIDVSEKFIKSGELVVSVMGRDTTDEVKYFSKEKPVSGKAKMVVLVDGGSASASEIVAGAIQDHDRGLIVGSPSFGKGLVQTVVPLTHNTSLKITTAKYFTPSGRSIQKVNYSQNNKVFGGSSKSVAREEYKTDNDRSVYSGGGIQPDSVISNFSKSKQVKNLLARGMFFRFATSYFNTNEKADWDTYDDEKMFGDFLGFLKNEEYRFTSKTELAIKKLQSAAEDESYSETLDAKIDELLAMCETVKEQELISYKGDIICELKKEISARRFGKEGRIMESLKHDKQFSTALSLLGSKEEYNVLLSIAE